MEKEIWKPVLGYENLYEISNLGRVKRLAKSIIDSKGRCFKYKEMILRNCISKTTGYPYVQLTKNGVGKKYNIHKLIADAFIPNPNNLPCINHIDENRSNSVLSNLERCSYLYNNTYGGIMKRRGDTRRNNSKRIIQYSLNGEIVAIHKKTLSEMKRILGYSIKGCVNGNKASAGGFVWRREGEPFDYIGDKYFLKPICQYDYYGNIIHKYQGGLGEIRSKTNFNIDNIRSCIKGKSKTSQGFVWYMDGETFQYIYKEKKIIDKKIRTRYGQQKKVFLLNENNEEVECFSSVSVAAKKFGFDRHYFTRAKSQNDIVTIRGNRFRVEKLENEKIPKGHKGSRPDLKGIHGKPICQYTKDGEFVKEYNSITEAALAMGKANRSSCITNCCKGNLKTAFGFIWYYKDSQPTINRK